MHEREPVSLFPAADLPRHAHQEVVDLLAAALLRLRGQDQPPTAPSIAADSDAVGLGFVGQERVNANPDHDNGVRP
jgi:hypothetical protein